MCQLQLDTQDPKGKYCIMKRYFPSQIKVTNLEVKIKTINLIKLLLSHD